MRLLLTTQVFPPETHPTAVMARELAVGLVQRGWDVTVAAGQPHHPTGRVAPGYGGALWSTELVEGVRVVRVWHPTTERRTIASRAAVMTMQMVATFAAALSAGRHDVVLSFGGPPLVGPILSGIAAALWRAPLVTVIHDLYPDVAIESGAVRNRGVTAIARLAEKVQYKLSNKLVVLGDATKRTLVEAKGQAPDAVDVLPVWLNPEEIHPGASKFEWRRAQGVRDDQFLVLYSGTAGIVSGAEILEGVARRLPPDVVLVLVGGGSAWSALEERRNRGLLPPNLRIIPYQPRELLPQVQAASDLSLVTLLPGRGRTSVPSKVQGYMAAGRPVLAAVEADCDTALLVQRERMGIVVEPASAQAIAEGIEEARRDQHRLYDWGTRARAAFERSHARDPIVDNYAELLTLMAARGRHG